MLDDLYALTPENKIDVEALQRLYDRVAAVEQTRVAETSQDGAWIDLTLAAGWGAHPAGTYPAGWKVVNGWVAFRGVAYCTAARAIYDPLFVLPAPAQVSQVEEGFALAAITGVGDTTVPVSTWSTTNALRLRATATVGTVVWLSGFRVPVAS